jgi:hypothetical protein
MFLRRRKSALGARRLNARHRRLWVEPLEDRRLLTIDIFTVTDGTDSFTGSAPTSGTFRWAIEQANADTSTNDVLINFSISGSTPIDIQPGSDPGHPGIPLPTITRDHVTIDGFTQGGSTNTSVLIELDGSYATNSGSNGLTVDAEHCVIKGLSIGKFSTGYGIEIDGDYNAVFGNNVGTDAAGTAAGWGNMLGGILISHASNNSIGGINPGDGNIVSGNGNATAHTGAGITIVGAGSDRFTLTTGFLVTPTFSLTSDGNDATGNDIQGNFIGLDASGTALPNSAQGILISHASQNLIGGSASAARNFIASNYLSGVEIDGSGDATVLTTLPDSADPTESVDITNDATRNAIYGNYIGLGVTGKRRGNGGDGVLINGASYSFVGGADTGDGNVISGNAHNGVHITGSTAPRPSVIDGTSAAGPTKSVTSTGAVPTFNEIQSNFIGTDYTGAAITSEAGSFGNDANGILVEPAGREMPPIFVPGVMRVRVE